MIRRKTNWNVYILAFLFTLFIFISGIFIGKAVTYSRAESLEISQKAISALFDLSNAKENLYNDSDYCKLSLGDIWNEKVEIGVILTRLENRLGKNNDKVLELKKLYHDVQIKTLSLVENSNERCGKGWDIVIFFYSNEEDDAGKTSELQGYILDTIYNSNKESLKVFSFDINLETNLTRDLEEKYEIERAPSLVINGISYKGFRSKNEIKRIIQE